MEQNTAVRQATKEFGISKSTVHMIFTKPNGDGDGVKVTIIGSRVNGRHSPCFYMLFTFSSPHIPVLHRQYR
ncbi:hypothetical protein RFF05_09235 [Bengtsoniella intestinalis]|uniref:hypothetical protein n=1 Tax=Bengtsoniella intestinalis TaxID=3073143 RepID=UPI00391F1AD4